MFKIAKIFYLGMFQKYYLSNHFKENLIQYPPLQIQSLSSSKPECLGTSGFIFDRETMVDSFSNYFHFGNRVNYYEWSPEWIFLIITILLEQICVKRGGDGDIMKINIWFRICSTVNMSRWWGCMPPHREWAFLEFKICDKCEDFCTKWGNHAMFEFRWWSSEKKTPLNPFF